MGPKIKSLFFFSVSYCCWSVSVRPSRFPLDFVVARGLCYTCCCLPLRVSVAELISTAAVLSASLHFEPGSHSSRAGVVLTFNIEIMRPPPDKSLSRH